MNTSVLYIEPEVQSERSHASPRWQRAKIGDPALTTYPFSASYTYNPNGTVSVAEFYSAGSPAAQKRYKYAFPTYDALNRLKSADFSSWNGTGWTSTLAYDLAGINYDPDGNITALQRYRESATLIDNLTYTYPGTSNRLTAVTDAVATTAEAWDAETGSFTHDANGNLKTAPAPYSITAVTYDPANLPLSITRSGATTTYRYDGAGQRITKQVGSGNTEVYVLEGASTLGVFTVNAGGTTTSWYFNLLAEGQVVGRQPNAGSRSYYYTDHLGSTRAAVQGATVVESYDFEPWGLQMPGRTLGSGTKEGFTGKEQDLESGLDYFGARYYLPALARWAAVDPLGDSTSEWSSYSYALDAPVSSVDPTGSQTERLEGEDAQAYFRYLKANRFFQHRGRQTSQTKAGIGGGGTGPCAGPFLGATAEQFSACITQKVGALPRLIEPWFGAMMIMTPVPEAWAVTRLAGLGVRANSFNGAIGEIRAAKTLAAMGFKIPGTRVGARTSAGSRFIDIIAEAPNGHRAAAAVAPSSSAAAEFLPQVSPS